MPFTTHSSGTAHFQATYGAAAIALQDHTRIIFERRSGVTVQAWATGVHDNGLVVLLPTHEQHDAQKALNDIHPAAVFSKAAAMAYEAFSAGVDMEDEDQDALTTTLLRASRNADQLSAIP